MKLASRVIHMHEVKIPSDDKGRLKFLGKKGNVITFKKPFKMQDSKLSPDMMKKNKSGMVSQVVASELKGNQIIGTLYSTPKFKSEKELLDAVNWQWMGKNSQD